MNGASFTRPLAYVTFRYPGPTVAPARGTKTSRRRVGMPTVTVANTASSVVVSTYIDSSLPILLLRLSSTSWPRHSRISVASIIAALRPSWCPSSTQTLKVQTAASGTGRHGHSPPQGHHRADTPIAQPPTCLVSTSQHPGEGWALPGPRPRSPRDGIDRAGT